MADNYGSDFLSIVDDDGTEYELEVLTTLEYNGATYMAVIPAATDDQALNLEVTILKSVEEDGEAVLLTIEDEEELAAVSDLIMDVIYEDEDTEQ